VIVTCVIAAPQPRDLHHLADRKGCAAVVVIVTSGPRSRRRCVNVGAGVHEAHGHTCCRRCA